MADMESIQFDAIKDMQFEARGGRKVLWELTVNGVKYTPEYDENDANRLIYWNEDMTAHVAYFVDKHARMHDVSDLEEDDYWHMIHGLLFTVIGEKLRVETVETIDAYFDTAEGVFNG